MSEPQDRGNDESRGRQMLGLAVVLGAQALIWFAIGYYTFEWMH